MEKISKYHALLNQLGLNKNESAIYQTLLAYGQLPIIELQRYHSNLKRTNLYAVIHSLRDKQLVIQTQKGTKTEFRLNDPGQLQTLVLRRQKEIEEQKALINAYRPNLIQDYQLSYEKPTARILEGVEGIKELYLDTISEGRPILSFLGLTEANESIARWLRRYYAPMRKRAKISARVIVSAEKSDPETKSYIKRSKDELREIKIAPKKLFPAVIEVQVYGNKVSFANYNRENAPVGIIIENKYIAETMSGLF
jgi:sugar-specific transcriptional regulator TrmB